MNRQVEIKCEQIARMVVKGMPKTQIAREMGMSYDGIMGICRHPGYLAIEEKVRKGVLDKMDARLDKRAEMDVKRQDLAEEVEEVVPEAMKVLIEGVMKKRDMKAALEVLDRDPRRQFAKASHPTVNPLQAGTPVLEASTLASAVTDADITHQILEKQRIAPVKPAEA